MLLKSYSFQNEVPNEVWELFKDAHKVSSGFDYSLEIIQNAMCGNISMDGKFNIRAYMAKVDELKRLEGVKSAKRFLSIVDDVDEFEEAGVPMGIPADKVAEHANQKDFVEEIIENDEVHFAVKEINNMATQIMFEHNIDVMRCLEQAIKGIPTSVGLIKNLVTEDAYVGELIRTILGSGLSFDEMFSDTKGVAI